MIKSKFMSALLLIVGVSMISMAFVVQEDISLDNKNTNLNNNAIDMSNVINMASSNRINNVRTTEVENNVEEVKSVSMEQVPQSVYIPPRVEVFDGLTLEELSLKLDRNLGDGYISGKGSLIASKCIELGVDPYLVTAIILHETGCKSNCSTLVKTCNNVGGQKGGPTCGGGSYKYYATLDEGIIGHIENLYKNYFSQGRTTVEAIAPKYAASPAWPGKINWYIETIRNS